MADNVNKKNIDDIVSGVHEALKTGEFSGAGVHFEFVEESCDSAIVFEDDETEKEVAPTVEKSPDNSKPEKADKASDDDSLMRESALGSSIWTTYVPRFTEVSDSYKMKKSDSIPPAPEPVPPVRPTVEKPVLSIDDDTVDAVDPTAEIENEKPVSDATLVTSGNSLVTDADEVSTVF